MTPAEIAARCANDPAFFAEVTLKIAEAMQGQEKIIDAAVNRLTNDDVQIVCQYATAVEIACWFRSVLGRSEP